MGWVLITANFVLSGDTAILWYQQPDSFLTIGLFKQHVGYVPPVDWPHLHALRQRSNHRSIVAMTDLTKEL